VWRPNSSEREYENSYWWEYGAGRVAKIDRWRMEFWVYGLEPYTGDESYVDKHCWFRVVRPAKRSKAVPVEQQKLL
jgi:hypothetical protein